MKPIARRFYLGIFAFAAVLSWGSFDADAATVRYNYTGEEFTTHINGFFPADDRFTGFIDIELNEVGGSLANKVIQFPGAAIPS